MKTTICDFCNQTVTAWRTQNDPTVTDGQNTLRECYPCALKAWRSGYVVLKSHRPDGTEFDEGDVTLCEYGVEGCDAGERNAENRCEQHNIDYMSAGVDLAESIMGDL